MAVPVESSWRSSSESHVFWPFLAAIPWTTDTASASRPRER